MTCTKLVHGIWIFQFSLKINTIICTAYFPISSNTMKHVYWTIVLYNLYILNVIIHFKKQMRKCDFTNSTFLSDWTFYFVVEHIIDALSLNDWSVHIHTQRILNSGFYCTFRYVFTWLNVLERLITKALAVPLVLLSIVIYSTKFSGLFFGNVHSFFDMNIVVKIELYFMLFNPILVDSIHIDWISTNRHQNIVVWELITCNRVYWTTRLAPMPNYEWRTINHITILFVFNMCDTKNVSNQVTKNAARFLSRFLTYDSNFACTKIYICVFGRALKLSRLFVHSIEINAMAFGIFRTTNLYCAR